MGIFNRIKVREAQHPKQSLQSQNNKLLKFPYNLVSAFQGISNGRKY